MRQKIIILLLFCLINTQAAKSDEIIGLMRDGFQSYTPSEMSRGNIYLKKAVGELDITTTASTETYEAYFHIPIAFEEQVPIWIEIDSPTLIDYRFIHLDPPNVMVAAKLTPGPTVINWTAWVLIKKTQYPTLPYYIPIPEYDELPDSVTKWLKSTDCAQLSAPIVQETAETVRDTTTNLKVLATSICNFCNDIPWTFNHSPVAFDAVYTLNWGNSCTGHAHAGAALFRANGVPARSILNIPTWYQSYMDMHWIIDYFVPEYCWIKMETSIGQNYYQAQNTVVTFVSNPGDEFPLFNPVGIDGLWHTSDPGMDLWDPDWASAHRAFDINTFADSTAGIQQAHQVTNSVFEHYTHYWGINLTQAQEELFQTAQVYHNMALTFLKDENDLQSYKTYMEETLEYYEMMDVAPITTFFFDDFESGINGWTHGGNEDEWELGTPSYGPAEAWSGENCWGTDLDDTYENGADYWLLSPTIDLNQKSAAYISFRVWNWVNDTFFDIHDPLWVEITLDGETFYPICSKLGGVNDDPAIDDVGGWSKVVLDLTKYIGNEVQIRFHFSSNWEPPQPGSYLDDVKVYGRNFGETGIKDEITINTPQKLILHQNYPNPFNPETTISFQLAQKSDVKLVIYDVFGKLIKTLINKQMETGYHSVIWDGKDENSKNLASGLYLYRIEGENFSQTKQCLLLK